MGTLDFRTVSLFVLDLIFSIFWFPSMIIFLSPFFLYKSFVTLIARCIRPDLIPLDTADQFLAWDLVIPKRPNERSVYNVGCSVRVSGLISIDLLRAKCKKLISNAIDSNGEKMYPRMEQTMELFGGYGFRRQAKRFDINTNIREVILKDKSVPTFEAEWISQGYPEESPPWELALISLVDAEETYILMKIHHSFADAYSLLYILNLVLDNDVPVPAKEPEDTMWEIV